MYLIIKDHSKYKPITTFGPPLLFSVLGPETDKSKLRLRSQRFDSQQPAAVAAASAEAQKGDALSLSCTPGLPTQLPPGADLSLLLGTDLSPSTDLSTRLMVCLRWKSQCWGRLRWSRYYRTSFMDAAGQAVIFTSRTRPVHAPINTLVSIILHCAVTIST